MKPADYESGVYTGFTEIIPSDTECCDPETVYPPCCKSMYIYGGKLGGQFSYTTCSGDLDLIVLESAQWSQIEINLCQPYEATGGVIITAEGP